MSNKAGGLVKQEPDQHPLTQGWDGRTTGARIHDHLATGRVTRIRSFASRPGGLVCIPRAAVCRGA